MYLVHSIYSLPFPSYPLTCISTPHPMSPFHVHFFLFCFVVQSLTKAFCDHGFRTIYCSLVGSTQLMTMTSPIFQNPSVVSSLAGRGRAPWPPMTVCWQGPKESNPSYCEFKITMGVSYPEYGHCWNTNLKTFITINFTS